MVGELIAKFPRRSGDFSSLKKFTQAAKVCAFNLEGVSGVLTTIFILESTRTNSSLEQRHMTVQIPGVCKSRVCISSTSPVGKEL